MHLPSLIRATACMLSTAALLLASPTAVNAQAKPTYTLFNDSVDLYLQQTCTDTPNGATFAGTIGAVGRSGSQSSLFYTFDGSGKKTGYESVSAVNTLTVAPANAGFTPNGTPDGAVHFRFVAVSASCSEESLYLWPASVQSVLDPDSEMYAYSLTEAVEEPLH